jgi:uncharacterized protein
MKYYKTKHLLFIIPILLAISAFILIQANEMISPINSEGSYVEIENRMIRVDLAITRDEQIQGLSDRAELCSDCGMLFLFPEKQVRSFWMKNMKFPIDIVWIDGDRIVKIDKNLPPEGEFPEISYNSLVGVDKVLELNAGYCDKHNIKIGSKINGNFEIK